MSRSYRKTPIIGNTTAASDKEFKLTEHRRERRAAKIAITRFREPADSRLFGNTWDTPKDGKHYIRKPVPNNPLLRK